MNEFSPEADSVHRRDDLRGHCRDRSGSGRCCSPGSRARTGPTRPAAITICRTCAISLRFDLDQRKVIGEVTHTLSALHDGLTHLDFDCADLTISSARVNGKDATFELRDNKLRVKLAQPAKSGDKFEVNLRYEGKPTTGLYFILPDKDDPDRAKEIWTQGEAEDTHHYIPIYDYPNDRTTSEMILTVPGDWLTVSNGKLLECSGCSGRDENLDVAAIAAGFHLSDFVRGRGIQGKEGHLAQYSG